MSDVVCLEKNSLNACFFVLFFISEHCTKERGRHETFLLINSHLKYHHSGRMKVEDTASEKEKKKYSVTTSISPATTHWFGGKSVGWFQLQSIAGLINICFFMTRAGL